MDHAQIRRILDDIKIFDRTFKLTPIMSSKGSIYEMILGWHLQVCYEEEDVVTGVMTTQESRRWVILDSMTESEIIDTAFAAVMRSFAHVVREHFTYKGKRVFSPHFTIEQRMAMASEGDHT